jgi:hypothetical protein
MSNAEYSVSFWDIGINIKVDSMPVKRHIFYSPPKITLIVFDDSIAPTGFSKKIAAYSYSQPEMHLNRFFYRLECIHLI